MDSKEHQKITEAVQHLAGVEVLPIPQDEEDVSFITITTPEGVHASSILNALDDNNLFGRTVIERRTMMHNPRPELGIVGMTAAGITFVHENRGK